MEGEVVREGEREEGNAVVWRNRARGLSFYKLLEQGGGVTAVMVEVRLQGSSELGEGAGRFCGSWRSSWCAWSEKGGPGSVGRGRRL